MKKNKHFSKINKTKISNFTYIFLFKNNHLTLCLSSDLHSLCCTALCCSVASA